MAKIRYLLATIAVFAIVWSSGSIVCADTVAPSPDSAYVRAVTTMRALATPPYARYRSTWQSTGLGFDFEQDDGRIFIALGIGSKTFVHDRQYTAAYRDSDRTLSFSDVAGEQFVGRAHFLEPTWTGAYDILRYGLRGEDAPGADAAVTSPSPIATGAASDTATGAPLANIATVTAIAPLFYRIEDEGSRPCQGLGEGRALHLIVRRDIKAHPLTDVVLDPASGRFCSMTFVIKQSGVAGITGHYTIDFAPYGDYWLVADGLIDINVSLLGISAKHTTLRWTIADLTTPNAVPEATFATPLPAPAPASTRSPIATSSPPT